MHAPTWLVICWHVIGWRCMPCRGVSCLTASCQCLAAMTVGTMHVAAMQEPPRSNFASPDVALLPPPPLSLTTAASTAAFTAFRERFWRCNSSLCCDRGARLVYCCTRGRRMIDARDFRCTRTLRHVKPAWCQRCGTVRSGKLTGLGLSCCSCLSEVKIAFIIARKEIM